MSKPALLLFKKKRIPIIPWKSKLLPMLNYTEIKSQFLTQIPSSAENQCYSKELGVGGKGYKV